MLVQESLNVGESVGEFIWRMAKERILTEEYTDGIAQSLGEVLAMKMPFQKFFPWKTMMVWIMDRTLPEYGLLALRKVLEVSKLIVPGDEYYHIPGIDPEVLPPPEGN